MSTLRRYTSAHIRDRETFNLMAAKAGLSVSGNLAFPRTRFQKIQPMLFRPRTRSLFLPPLVSEHYDTYMDKLQRVLPDLVPHGEVPRASVANY